MKEKPNIKDAFRLGDSDDVVADEQDCGCCADEFEGGQLVIWVQSAFYPDNPNALELLHLSCAVKGEEVEMNID